MPDARSIASRDGFDPAEFEAQLAEDYGQLAHDPLGFVHYNYEWGKGDLEGYSGPDTWQTGFLREWGEEIRIRDFDGHTPVEPQMFTTVSGHGVGKSALVGWVCDYIPSTRPFCRGRVTANTAPQLHSTTWTEIAKWTRRAINGHWWKLNSGAGSLIKAHRSHPDEWFVRGLAWSKNAPDAFAGQHAPTSTSFYVFDEASGIERSIVETAKGGLVTGEPMMFFFGNGTRNSGAFWDTHRDAKESRRFRRFNVDARTSGIANHALHNSWIEQYGLDSDFVRVRVLGEFPKQSSAQFIPNDFVWDARKREVPKVDPTEPLILGVDVALYGDDECRFVWRRGRDARSIPSTFIERSDAVVLANHIQELDRQRRPDAIVLDVGGNGGPVLDILRHRKMPNVHGVNFGTRRKGTYAYQNAWMMGQLRDWLRDGGAIEDDDKLGSELTGREYWLVGENQIMLEPKELLKERINRSPDWSDALCTTFAVDIGPRSMSDTRQEFTGGGDSTERVGAFADW